MGLPRAAAMAGCVVLLCAAFAAAQDAAAVVGLAGDAAGPRSSGGALGGGWAVGDQIGVRLVGGDHETDGKTFWVAAPVGSRAWLDENFGVVSASLWLRGRWGGAESIVAAAIFAEHCGAGRSMVDVGSHVGYFTLLAQAHGCATTSVDMSDQFAQLLRVSQGLNGFPSPPGAVVVGPVPRTWTYDALAGGRAVLFAKFDIEGAEADALSTGAAALARTDFVYVELSTRRFDDGVLVPEGDFPAACDAGGHALRVFRALLDAGFDLSILRGAISGGGFPRCGALDPIELEYRQGPDEDAAAVCFAIYGLFGADDDEIRRAAPATLDIYGAAPPLRMPAPMLECGAIDYLDRRAAADASGVAADALEAGAPGADAVEVVSVPHFSKTKNAWREGGHVHFYFAVYAEDAPTAHYRARVAVATANAEALITDYVCLPYAIDINNCARILDALEPFL